LRKTNFPYDDLTFSSRVDAPGIETWIKGFFEGKLRAKVKTEISSSHNHEHIVKVTGQSFNSIVMDQTKDVLVEFYSPKCEHCKSFLPIYEAIGEALCEIDSVVVAQMDAINNDAPPGVIMGVGGYPTITLFPAKRKNKPIEFKGNKTVQEILLFLQKNCSTRLTLPKLNYTELNEKLSEATKKSATHVTHIDVPVNPIYKATPRDRTEL
jgi:protein disulfide-isomerase A1